MKLCGTADDPNNQQQLEALNYWLNLVWNLFDDLL